MPFRVRSTRTLAGALSVIALLPVLMAQAPQLPATPTAKPQATKPLQKIVSPPKEAQDAKAPGLASVKPAASVAPPVATQPELEKPSVAEAPPVNPTPLVSSSASGLPAKPRGYKPFNELGRTPHPEIAGPLRIPDSQIEPLTWNDLDGWKEDNHAESFKTFTNSCKPVLSVERSNSDPRPVLPALAAICRRAAALNNPNNERARQFFEENFLPTRITKLGDAAGFLTGYYEPVVEGSRFPTQIFKVPVYRRPLDLIPPEGYVKGQGFPNTGKSMRKDADGKLVQYYERGDVENGALDGNHYEICWLKDPVDLFYIQIQGSGRVKLEDGTVLRINYDSHNGHPYTAIGRILIERGLVPRNEMSMDRIRDWMSKAPDGGKELRSFNKSFVFFRVVGLSDKEEAPGAQGIPLTAKRSIAVDKALHVYGTPFYIEAELPLMSGRDETKFRRLMIAQDTGSAIVGPARADIYYGAGDEAGRIAGRLRNPGKFAMLMPRELDPAAAGAKFPLPQSRPNVEDIVAKEEKSRAAGDKAPGPVAQAEKPAAAVPTTSSPAPLPQAKPKAAKKPNPKPETSRTGSGA
jgi:membrane-bound lytic murein transglycosylase A